MAKDPAFLFYSKDWIEGTAELLPDEKGVYIDLLCYQHQRGDLPNDTKRLARMVGMSVQDFETIWSVIGCKFEAKGERTLNRKLSEVMGERKEKGHRNKIIGVFGSLCRKSELSYMDLRSIRSQFKVADFEHLDSESISERLSEWFNERLALLGNVDANEDVVKDYKGVGQKKLVVPALDEFVNYGLEQSSKHRLNVSKTSLTMKYDAWKLNGWVNGNGQPIKNWKSSLINTLKYIQDEQKKDDTPKTIDDLGLNIYRG